MLHTHLSMLGDLSVHSNLMFGNIPKGKSYLFPNFLTEIPILKIRNSPEKSEVSTKF